MCKTQKRYRVLLMPMIFAGLIFFCNPVYNQTRSDSDATVRIPNSVLLDIWKNSYILSDDTLFKLPSFIIPETFVDTDKSRSFFDSLKIFASKNALTRKIYDVVITSHGKSGTGKITGSSDASYLAFSGKKIRKIIVQRLNVFGTDINNPGRFDTRKVDNLLNRIHVNTRENIIRKSLLFSVGDTISPLKLSDNERILRQLSYIEDARITPIPVSEDEVDILVLTKDVYSFGGAYDYGGLKKGDVTVFEKNIFGTGHEFGLEMPFDDKLSNSPGFGAHYLVNNISKTFMKLKLYYYYGLGVKTYGFNLSRDLISSSTKYAFGISIRQMYTTEDLDTLPLPAPLKYNLQDYWLSRAFLINKESVSRIILGIRYTNNNVFDHPLILPDSYQRLQNYKIFLGSAALSIQKYYKSNLIYGYGRTEDIPYGGLIRFTAGSEVSEFTKRTYFGSEAAMGKLVNRFGYFYTSAGIGTYFNGSRTEQGLFSLHFKYFSDLLNFGNGRIRNFINIEYTRGFGRYTDEYLAFKNENGFSGFRNDSVIGNKRLCFNVESVLFSRAYLYGFRFAFFGFADFSYLSGSNQWLGNGYGLSAIGLGVRIRNDNLVFNTLQLRFGYFPNPPDYSRINWLIVSGEQLLRPNNFDSGPPSVIPYR
jgi:hypothetical protein